MLTEAHIEVVDDAGTVKDRARIVGNAEVALANARLRPMSDDPTDVDAVIAVRDGAVTVEAKKDQTLRVGRRSFRWRSRSTSGGWSMPSSPPRSTTAGYISG